jgi:hypothetical protein
LNGACARCDKEFALIYTYNHAAVLCCHGHYLGLLGLPGNR